MIAGTVAERFHMSKPTALVIGSGIIGLAVARSISPHCTHTIIIDSNSQILSGVSSRSSQVIHSGIYNYPPSKQFHCKRGRDLLYDYCKRYSIPHKRTGKFLVANTDAQCDYLDYIAKTTALPSSEFNFTNNLDSRIKAKSALYVKTSGIVDVFELGNCMLSQCISTDVAFNSTLSDAEYRNGQWNCLINDDWMQFDVVVNAAGLTSAHISRILGLTKHKIVYGKGHYLKYIGKDLKGVHQLVYPVPDCRH